MAYRIRWCTLTTDAQALEVDEPRMIDSPEALRRSSARRPRRLEHLQVLDTCGDWCPVGRGDAWTRVIAVRGLLSPEHAEAVWEMIINRATLGERKRAALESVIAGGAEAIERDDDAE